MKIMKTLKTASFLLILTFVFTVPMTGLADDLAPTKVVLTFNQPFAIPGVVLGPGTYVFKISGASSETVQILDAKEQHIYATVLTSSTRITETSTKTLVQFEPNEAGAPPAIKFLTPANHNIGREFVY